MPPQTDAPMPRLVIDLDNTIAFKGELSYRDADVNWPVVDRIREFRDAGFEIVIHTSRNMRSFDNNLGKIIANTVPELIDWLKEHEIPYDEIWVGKPWCGHDGFYVDDCAVRPDEFVSLDRDQLYRLTGR